MPAYDASFFNPPAPVARVTLRNQENARAVPDVLMLLDSGADVTLIPQGSVSQLGLHVDPSEGYQLKGFDGSIGIAQAAQLDLVFLERVFRGRYLLINQEWGLLGRDILNHVALLLDGPNLKWSDHRSRLYGL